MTEQAVAQVAKQLADLRLQVNALETVSKGASLPEMLKQTRRTITWSALVIAIALIVSSVIKIYGDTRIKNLEDRIQALEHGTKAP